MVDISTIINTMAPKMLQRALPPGISFDFKSARFRSEKTGQYVSAEVVERSVLTPKSAALLSNNLTLLEKQFLRMSAYSKNITTLREAQFEYLKDTARENALESAPAAPEVAPVQDQDSTLAAVIDKVTATFQAKKEGIISSTARAIVALIGMAVLAKMLSPDEAMAQEAQLEPTPTPTTRTRQPGITPEAERRVEDTSASQPTESYPAVPSNIDVILRTIRKRESGSEAGDYTVHDTISGSSASGAYQFTNSTWQSLASKYGVDISSAPRAYMATPEAQDYVARRYVEEILSNTGGDVSMVPVVWLTGNYQGIMSAKGAAINPSVEEYRRNWMNDYRAMLGATGSANSAARAGGGGVDLTPDQRANLPQITPTQARNSFFRAPARGVTSQVRISSRPGMRTLKGERRYHAGYDLAGRANSPVRVIAGGIVSFAGVQSGYGNIVKVIHDKEGRIETRYAHLNSINVSPGQSISSGDVVGLLGNTGRSTGPHLHFEYRVDGKVAPLSGSIERRLPQLLVPDQAPQISAASPPPGMTPGRAAPELPRMAGLTPMQAAGGSGANKQQYSASPAGEYARYLGAGVAHA